MRYLVGARDVDEGVILENYLKSATFKLFGSQCSDLNTDFRICLLLFLQ